MATTTATTTPRSSHLSLPPSSQPQQDVLLAPHSAALSEVSVQERTEDEIAPSGWPKQETNQSQRRPSLHDTQLLEKPVQECAICLDTILPRQHATAVLACQHTYHLSCISVAFKCRREMICPLCRHSHKDQPFQSQGDSSPTSTSSPPTRTSSPDFTSPRAGRGFRHDRDGLSRRSTHVVGSTTHLQQHLSNLMQHQRRNYLQELATHEHPTSGTVLSMLPPFFTPPATSTVAADITSVSGGGNRVPGEVDGAS
ncbi:hypothetical protein BGW42_005275, partial [Actinomortierella wolfii]